jgi:hypothetical protein
MSACDATWPACVGLEYDAKGRYVPMGGFVPYVPTGGMQGAELPSVRVGFVPRDAAQSELTLTTVDKPRGRRAGALRRDDGEPASLSPLPPPPPPSPSPPLLPPPPPLPLPSTPVAQRAEQRAMRWATSWGMRWEEGLGMQWEEGLVARDESRDERRRLEESSDTLHEVSTLQVMYTAQGGRDLHANKVRGDVLSPRALSRIREIEAEIAAFSAEHLTRLDSAVPCLLGQKRAAAEAGGALAWYRRLDEGATSEGAPSQANVRACVYGMQVAGEAAPYFASDLDLSGIDGASNVTCAALRSAFTLSGADDAWVRVLIYKLYSISGGSVEVSAHGDLAPIPSLRQRLSLRPSLSLSLAPKPSPHPSQVSFYGDLFWAEFYMNLIHDVVFVVLSLLLIWVFTASVLRMPLYAALALALVFASFPVAFAFYSGPLASSKAPILALLSLYLVLGIGVDAIFVLSNSYALAEQNARRTHGRTHGGLEGVHGHGGGHGGGLRRRAASEAAVLVRALRHSVGVTGLSTMTTAVAFGASVASPITTIRQFAMFQTSVVRVAA